VTTMRLTGPGGRGRRLRGDKSGSGGGLGDGGFGGGRGNFIGRGTSGGAGGTGGGGSLSGGKNPLSRLTHLYVEKLRNYPIVTKVLTSFLGFAIASLIIEGKDAYPKGWKAVAVIALTGGLVHGLGGHYYYCMSERAFPGTEILNLGGKIALDYVLWLPLISLALTFARDLYKGRKIDEHAGKSYLNSWSLPAPIWLVYSGALFKFAPVAERTAFYNGVLIFTSIAKRLSHVDKSTVQNITSPKK
jgi:hypothetical protein